MFRIRMLHGLFTILFVRTIICIGFNHALDKPTLASSVMKETKQFSKRLVDGCYTRRRISSQCCFASEVEQYPWISVDLLVNIKVRQIVIYGILCPGRLLFLGCIQSNPLWVMLGNDTSDLSTYNSTYFTKHSLSIYGEGIFDIKFDSSVNARYVGIKKFNEGFPQNMIVCEIEIFGECLEPIASENCLYTCHCSYGTCDGPNGRCMSECEAGWMTDRCDQPCTKGFYGQNCASTCPTCVRSDCNSTNGHCLRGCNPGMQGEMCLESCSHGTWGSRCENQCEINCANGCNSLTGSCNCLPGWHGNSCRKKCKPGFYGEKCARECNINCLSKLCHHVTGLCSHGCEPGWSGAMCENECLTENVDSCYNSCPHCGNGSCDTYTGECLDSCPEYKYGLYCNYDCGHCFDNTQCNKVNGHCPNGCQSLFTGSRCDEKEASADRQTLSGAKILVITISIVATSSFISLFTVVMVYKRRNQMKVKSRTTSRHKVAMGSSRSTESKQTENVNMGNL